MIRRDYILRMIEEFMQALSRIRSLKQGQPRDKVIGELDVEFRKLLGEGARAVVRLSETELLARLMRAGPTHALRDKTLMLTTLLKETGDAAMAENRIEAGREFHLKALHLLLETLARGDVFECPEFVPKVGLLVLDLQGTSLPTRTHAMLMQHYERTSEFAKAEDALFAMFDAEPENNSIVEFGITFYQRLLSQSDAALNAANLPRAEVEEGLKKLHARRQRSVN